VDRYNNECHPPIPIGVQRYAYQCENIVMEPIHGAISIHAFVPRNGGKEPYPNKEKDQIDHYELKIEKFTGNSISLLLSKRFKDKSEEVFLTNVSFADLVNRLFTGHPANHWINNAPVDRFEKEVRNG
jgi:hypothetical protein